MCFLLLPLLPPRKLFDVKSKPLSERRNNLLILTVYEI